MDILGLFTIPNWLMVILLLFTALYIYFTWNFGTLEAMGLPTPKPLPFLGNLYREFTQYIPDEDVRCAKLYGKTHGFYFSRIPTVRTSDPDFIKEICVKEFNSFTDHMQFDLKSIDPIMNKFITQLSGEEWRITRNLLTPSFTSGKLRQMIPLIEKCATELTDIFGEKADNNQSFEMKEKYMAYLTDIIATCAFGLELNSQRMKDNEFVTHAKNLVAKQRLIFLVLAFIFPGRILKWLKIQIMSAESMGFFKKVVFDIIKCRQESQIRRNDFLQLMLDAVEDQRDVPNGDPQAPKKPVVTYDTVAAQSVLFLFAGFETTGSTLSFISYNIATHPECQEKLIQEIDEVLQKSEGRLDYEALAQLQYMEMVIYETLRMYPPAIRTDRMCTKDCVINGIPIRKGMPIAVNIFATMNDEDFYENPKQFNPERFEAKESRNSFTYLAFGTGPRSCIGMRFALMEMKLTLVHILKKFRFKVSNETIIPMRFHKAAFNLTPLKPIQLKVERRN